MLEATTPEQPFGANSILFLDASVPDYQSLIAGVTTGTEVVLLDPKQDGVEQISQILSKNSDIKTVHIVSHGAVGSLQLGASYLELDNLNNYAGELQNWASALTPDADILLYGCEVADGQTGLNFVQQLSQLTGADVAASDDLTGSAALNGDWDLEVKTGAIEAPLAFQFGAMQGYNSVLASVTQIGTAQFASNYTYSGTTVGGLSGITYDAINNKFYAISDDKSNVRFYTLNIDLSSGSLPAGGVTFTGMTLLKDSGGNQLAANVSDTEGIAFTNNGNAFVSSEGLFATGSQQFIDRFNISTGNRNQSLPVDTKFAVSGDTSSGIRNNRGFENLTVTPDGKYLFTATEVALEQDSTSASGSPSRIVKYNLSTGSVEAEFVYNSESGNGISELLAVDENTLLAIDRSVSNGFGSLYQVSVQGATDIKNNNGLIASGLGGITAAQKTLVTSLPTNFFSPTNFEGMTFGPTLPNGKLSLILVGDNNFGTAGPFTTIPTPFLAFEFTPDTPSFTVTNTNDTGIGSLRQAIANANATPGTNTIDFKISTTDAGYNSATGTFTIKPKSALPNITDAVIIDGTTQTGFANKPIIELDGSSAGASVDGLKITAGNSTVKGLVINRFSEEGIELIGGNNVITGNYIGTNATGTAAAANRWGIFINNSASNTIGGTTATTRNVISGNSVGLFIGGSGATGNNVQGNYIGTDVNGNIDLGNTADGVNIQAPNNIIGGTALGAGNVISGNNQNGVNISQSISTGNQVLGNSIGTNAAGNADLGNTMNGVEIQFSSGNIIGGTTAAARNVISGNNSVGVHIAGDTATQNQVIGNYIGTNATGTGALGNSFSGVRTFAPNNIIGGTAAGAGNVISGNNFGVLIGGSTATGNKVQGNLIGTQANGTTALGNTSHGVYVANTASNNIIGGTVAGEGNAIASNGGDGVYVESSTGNRILSNSIFSNTGLGIDLGADGVTLNDAGDGDTGANNQQNFPIITSVNGSTVTGTLNSAAIKNYRIEFFANTTEDPTKYGEGEVFLGFQNVSTDGGGNASFNFNFTPNQSKPFITATATLLDASNNPVETSEFSRTPLQTGTLEFTAANYGAAEGSSGNVDKAIAKVKRTGGSAGAISVQVLLSATPGTATSPDDYINQLPVIVTFNDGEIGEKNVIIPIVGDTTVESAETINLLLGNPMGGAGLGTQQSATFTIENDDAAKTPPVLDLNGSDSGTGYNATFTRSKGAVAIADSSKLTVTDADSANMSKVTVSLNTITASDVLAVNTSGTSITSSYANGVLTLTGNATKEQYQQVLRTVTYNNTSVVPETGDRIVNFTIYDDNNTASTTVQTALSIQSPTIFLGTNIAAGLRSRPPIGTLSDNNPDALYEFDLGSSTRVVAHLALNGGNADLGLYDGKGNLLVSSTSSGSLSENLDRSGLLPGRYYLRVFQAFPGQSLSYKLSVNFA